MKKNDLYNLVMGVDARNTWGEVVKEYALELIDGWEGDNLEAMKLVNNYIAYLDILAVFGTDLDAVRQHLEESLPGEAVKALGDYDNLRDGLDAAMEVLGC